MNDEKTVKARPTWRLAFPYLITITILTLFVSYLYRNAGYFKQLLHVSITSLGMLFVLTVIIIFFNGMNNYVLFRGLGARLSLNEGIGLAMVNSMANQLTFATGGLITISIYLKKKFGLSYLRFLSAALAFYVIAVAANGLIGLVVLSWWAVVKGIRTPAVLYLAFGAMTASVLLFKLPLHVGVVPGRWKERLSQIVDGLQTLLQNRALVGKMLGLQYFLVVLYSLQLYISFHIFSQKVSIGQCLLFAAANIVTQAISFTPDALGVREAVIGSVATMLGYNLGASMVAVGLSRVVTLPTVVTGGAIYAYVLSKKAASAPLVDDSERCAL